MSFNFSAINLWCNKNLVDLEFIIWEILKFSTTDLEINLYDAPEDDLCEYVIINTCGFLSTSREEAEKTIRYYDELGKKVIIVGCYISVKDDNFLKSLKNLYSIIPFVDYKTVEKLIFGKENNTKLNIWSIIKLKSGLKNIKESKLNKYLDSLKVNNEGKKAFIWKWNEVRAYFNDIYEYEYLKISEWCDNACSFCIIPKIRWKQKSRDIEDILAEVQTMVSNGIREIEIISQDTTRYGIDNYGQARLIDLLREIDNIPWDFKYRVFYLYPDIMTQEAIKQMKNLKKLIPYFDIPFQHISPMVLKKMWRFYDSKHIHNFLDSIRDNFDENFLHTNFIIWFPGETEEDFQLLLDFVKKYEFDSVSVFGYHDEPLAPSYRLDTKIPEEIILDRLSRLWKILDTIYDKKDKARKGKTHKWYIMDISDEKVVVRPEIKAPEIDDYDEVNNENIRWKIELGNLVEYIL